VIGCNTIGHLAAGLVEVQRTGDDTSGRRWECTRRMGVNTLAFRLAQHRTFFAMDAGCVLSTPTTPWDKNSQFLELLARSGTAVFVSVDPTTRNRRVDEDLRRAIAIALDEALPVAWSRSTGSGHRLRAGGGPAAAT
jgi:alpha-galactosidase